MAFICGNCQFNFDDLKITVLYEQVELRDDMLCLHCPACGMQLERDLKLYQIIPRQGRDKLYIWRSTTSADHNVFKVRLGNLLTLQIPEERVDVISAQEICYPAVAVFKTKGGFSIPTWPVRREFLDLIDRNKKVRAEIVQDRYRIHLPLKGLDETIDVSLPLVPVRMDRPALEENSAFEGVHLALWPNVPYKQWKRYFIRFGATKDEAQKIVNSSRDLKVYAYAQPGLDPEIKDWVPVSSIAGDGFTRFACVESRPELLSIEFVSKDRSRITGGGIWAVEPAPEENYPSYDTVVAVDYGTSNTFVAWRDINAQEEVERTKPIPIDSCEKYIIHGAELPDAVDFADTWPPRAGFGRSRTLLPSEILTREPLKELRIRAQEVKHWKPVVNYGVPSNGVDIKYSEGEHIIADFKWQDMIREEAFRQYFRDLQKRYLEYVLFFSLAQLATKKSLGSSVRISFSYPLAFSEIDKQDFEGVLDDVCRELRRQTGIPVKADLPLDEARAAASSEGELNANYFALLYIDIGGGSSDIALEVIGESKRSYVSIASFQYAGGGLVSALAEGKCLKPDIDIDRFRRMIREVGQVGELIKMGTVFHANRMNPVNTKTYFFYAYLLEYLARLLAAHLINGEWKEVLTEAEKQLALQNGYLIGLYPLGNGWGFGHILDPKYARDVFSQELADRTNQIIRETMEMDNQIVTEQLPHVIVKGEDLKSDDPKGAVAYGLLKGAVRTANNGESWSFKTIVGWTTRVGRVRSVPWYRPVTNRGHIKPQKEEALPQNVNLDCLETEWPVFPRRLHTPHALDPNLNKTRQHMLDPDRGCIRSQAVWFSQSPFHVLLEKLFKQSLKELA